MKKLIAALAVVVAGCSGDMDAPQPGPPVNGATCEIEFVEGMGHVTRLECETDGEAALCLEPGAHWVEDTETGTCVLEGNRGAAECEVGGSPECPEGTELVCMQVIPDCGT